MPIFAQTVPTASPLAIDRKETLGRFLPDTQPRAQHVVWHSGHVSATVRERVLGQRPLCLWMTGLSAAGKSTLAYALEKQLLDRGQLCYVLDGDNLRHHLNSDLGFSVADRRENLRRAAEVAHLFNEAGMIVITAFISPLRADRAMAAEIIGHDNFVEVYVKASGKTCEQRDPKGLYAKARRGEIPQFTGVSAPYEEPETPDFTIDTELTTTQTAADQLLAYLAERCLMR